MVRYGAFGARFVAAGLALLGLQGCLAPGDVPHGPQPSVSGAFTGSRVGSRLSGSDRAAVELALWQSLQAKGTRLRTWKNPETGSAGHARASGASLRDVDYKAGTELVAPLGLDAEHILVPDSGRYSTSTNSNVRLGPSTEHRVAKTLKEGTLVDAVARVQGRDWVLVASDDRALGYVYAPLLTRAEGDTLGLALAGGSARQPRLCRRFEMALRLGDGTEDRWGGTACRSGSDAWKVVSGRVLNGN